MKKIIQLFVLTFLITSAGEAQPAGYWQQHVDYSMDIVMDVEKHQFDGYQKLVYTNNSPDVLNRVFYHLYFNAFQPGSMMDVRSRNIADPDSRVGDRILNLPDDEIGYHKILSLTQDGEPVDFSVEGTILVVELNENIQPGTSTTFEMEFESQVPRQIRRSGWDNEEGVEFSMSQWYPKLAEYDHQGWHPNPYVAREFHGVFGNFNVNITINSDYIIGATGLLQNPNEIGHGYEDEGVEVTHNSDEQITWRFRAENVLDFFWGADPDFVHTTAQVPNGPKLHFFYQQPVVDKESTVETNQIYTNNWESLPEFTVRAFEYANETFGKYPYPQFSVVQGGDGGMEYPMGTLITGGRSKGSLEGVTLHEIFHSWYQNVIATNEALYAWMDEGFVDWAEEKSKNHLYERDSRTYSAAYSSYYDVAQSGFEEPMNTHSDHFYTNYAYSRATYTKGHVFLTQLGYIIGEDQLMEGMRKYHDIWKLKHPTDLDFLSVMEDQSGMILDWYMEYFVRTTKRIDYEISSVDTTFESVNITLKRNGLVPMPIDLVVEYEDGSQEAFYIPLRIMRGEKENEFSFKRTVLEDWPWVNPTYSFKIPKGAAKIISVEIDPSERLADINRQNNVYSFSE